MASTHDGLLAPHPPGLGVRGSAEPIPIGGGRRQAIDIPEDEEVAALSTTPLGVLIRTPSFAEGSFRGAKGGADFVDVA